VSASVSRHASHARNPQRQRQHSTCPYCINTVVCTAPPPVSHSPSPHSSEKLCHCMSSWRMPKVSPRSGPQSKDVQGERASGLIGMHVVSHVHVHVY
jgi:hypothetical protein